MNKTFKTIWNEARRCYIVADEAQKSHGKPSKCAVVLAVAATAFLSGAASAAYVDPGFVAQNASQVDQAIASWETSEYQSDWGLAAMNASKAYALGYHGQGVTSGVMDSGALLSHPDLAGGRITGTEVSGNYGADGNRYPQNTGSNGENPEDGLPYEKGEAFEVTGNWMQDVNDSHGTHVTGTVGANRDGNRMHGVAWGADVIVGNTGATDNNNYGPFQDYDYFYAGWSAIADGIEAANGSERGGVINNSWGTNIRVVNNGSKGDDNGNTGVHFSTQTTSLTEYEYFLFKENYQDKYVGTDHEGKSFVDAAYDAVKDTNIVQVFTAGNRDFDNPFYRPLYPYFNPDAEQHWINVGGLTKAADGKYSLWATVNEAGNAKWWTVVAPGTNIDSTTVDGVGNPGYSNTYSGTSMSAPHVTGAMTVLMSRYQDMNAIQVRDVLFTTATHKNADGTNFEGWDNDDGTTPAEGEVSDRMGWGMPDLDKGMYGLGQLLGHFDYNMATTELDVWSNDISQVALDQREREDSAWKAAAEKWLKADNAEKLSMSTFTEEEKALIGEVTLDTADDIVGLTDEQEQISEEDAIAWRTEYFNKRLAAIEARQYDGELTKRGQGTLIMTGNNTYRGGTTVEEGMLLGFNDSFGVTGEDSSATANGKVTVNGGVFGIMNAYNDQFTMKGELVDSASDHSVDITVNAGGTYGIVAGQDVEVGELTFEEGAGITVVSTDVDVLTEAYNGNAQTGSVTATSLEGAELAVANPDYAFFTTSWTVDGNKLTGTLERDETKTVASYATTDIGRNVANVIGASTDSAIFGALVGRTKDEVSATLSSLDSDFYLSAQNASAVNALSVARAVKDQAIGIGEGRKVEMKNGTARIWATGIGSWMDVDYGTSADVDTYAGMIGAEVDITDSTKIGAFFGYGTTDFDASEGKIESDDIHFGLYGETAFDVATLTYGLIHTNQDRDISHSMTVAGQVGGSNDNGNATITQVFAEAAYTGFNTQSYAVEPYAGLTYMMIETDEVSENVGGMSFNTKMDDANLAVTTLGVRGAIPFTAGSVAMQAKADVAWNHFFGDTEAEAKFQVADAGWANIKGEELKDMATVGVGIEAQLNKSTTLGFSYTGAFDGDITSHGVGANLRINF